MEYTVSIRINLPEEIATILQKEKERFVAEYGSGYKSDPHITLYFDRYNQEGFPRLIHNLQELQVEPFTISLLRPEVRREEDRRRNLYVMAVSNKESLRQLQVSVSEIAISYESPLLRSKVKKRLAEQGIHIDGKRENLKLHDSALVTSVFDPHITLGEVGLDDPQPDLAIVQKNLEQLEGKQVDVSSFVVHFHEKKDGDEKYKLIEKVSVPLVEIG